MAFRQHFRDKQQWLDSTDGTIKLNTASDEAAKMYDASLTQLCGWYEDETLGGLENCIDRMLKADPEFALGRALELELELMGGLTAPRLNRELAEKLDKFNQLIERRRGSLSEQELLHAEVVNCWASSKLKPAGRLLEQLVTRCPEDVLAVKMAQDTYFFLGQGMAMRNSAAASLAQLTRADRSPSRQNPLEGFVHGMMAFAFEESNMYPQAQREALKALEMNPRDTWAIHNYAHCLEMQGESEQGLKWMLARQHDWEPCQGLACHQFWHTALFHINNEHFDEAVGLLDREILRRCKSSCSSLDLHDAASMLYRMQLVDLFGLVEKKDPEEKSLDSKRRWQVVKEICKPHARDHLIGFNDAHFLMAFLGSGDQESVCELYSSAGESRDLNEGQQVVYPLLEAMIAFNEGVYDQCVDKLEPVRHELVKIGGSHAQRDVFEQLLLVAALKSDKAEHNLLGKRMLAERDVLFGRRLPQTELLAASC